MERLFKQGPVIEIRGAGDLIEGDILNFNGKADYCLESISQDRNGYYFSSNLINNTLYFDKQEIETLINEGHVSRLTPIKLKINSSSCVSRCIE